MSIYDKLFEVNSSWLCVTLFQNSSNSKNYTCSMTIIAQLCGVNQSLIAKQFNNRVWSQILDPHPAF